MFLLSWKDSIKTEQDNGIDRECDTVEAGIMGNQSK